MTNQTISPILTIPQTQALLDTAHRAFGGKYAAYYVLRIFLGKRPSDLSKGNAQYELEHAERWHPDNLLVMVGALKAAGLYADTNLRPNDFHCLVIQNLAGFACASVQAIERADRERMRLAKLGIVLEPYNWGIPFPRNALRRTAVTMHYKLFGSAARTAEWAGHSKLSLPMFGSHKTLVTISEARQFWAMLPSHIQAAGLKVRLPADNKLGAGAIPTALRW